MGTVLKAGVGLAITVSVISALIAATGMHTNLVGGLVFLVLAIGLNIAAVVWALRKTASEAGYGMQLFNAGLLGLIAGGAIFALSLLMLTVVFPDYMDEWRQAQLGFLEASGLDEATLEPRIQAIESATAFSQSLSGLIGTFFTSLIVGAITAIFARRKG